MEEFGTPDQPQALAASTGKDKKTPAKQNAETPQTPAGTRRTRSQAAPDWTVQEMLILVAETFAVSEGWLKALSSYQKWKMISDNCAAFDVNRPSYQCKRRWELLLANYQKIKDWESWSGAGSYWSLDDEGRMQHDLPASFSEEVFSSMDAVMQAQEDQPGAGDSESEDLIATTDVEMLDVDDFDPVPKEQGRSKTRKNTTGVRDMANKLRESAEQVHTILKGELTIENNGTRALVDLVKPNAIQTEFTRRQADQLIKAFGDMVGTLNQFTELIKDGRCEENGVTN